MTFNVSISNPVDTAVTMTANTADVSATAGSDYTAVSGATVTFPANTTANQTVSVTVNGDTTVELNETLNLVLSALSAGGRAVTFTGGGSTLTGTGTIINDDSATISINAPSILEGGILAYSVTINNPVDVAVTADRATADGLVNPATVADSDYTAIANSNVTLFAAGSTTAFAIPVQTTADNKVELDEQLRLILANLAAGGRNVSFSGGGSTLTGTGTITNDDSATISISSPSVTEGNSGTTTMTFNVSLSNPVDTAVSMTANTANVSATAGSDYTAVSGGTVTFAANSTTAQTVNVTVSGDTSIEANETLQLVLSTLSAGGRNVSFSGGGSSLTGTGTINNDDSETLTISSPSVTEGNSGTVNMVFTVTSPLAVQGGFTVAFTLADVTTNSTDHAAFPTGVVDLCRHRWRDPDDYRRGERRHENRTERNAHGHLGNRDRSHGHAIVGN